MECVSGVAGEMGERVSQRGSKWVGGYFNLVGWSGNGPGDWWAEDLVGFGFDFWFKLI